MAFVKTTVKIASATPGWNLDAWRYIPTRGSAPYPVVVLAHGLAANKLMGLGKYAEAFASAGYACLVFDYRHWGDSDGIPRYIAIVTEQQEDYRTVIKYARQQEEFDPHRVILWGTSFSGCHVINLSADSSVNAHAAIAQCPFIANTVPPTLNLGLLGTLFFVAVDLLKQSCGLSPAYIKLSANPGEIGVLTAPGSLKGVNSIVANPADYPNEIAASGLLQVMRYTAIPAASKIACPLIIVAVQDDILCPIKNAEDVAKAGGMKVELARLPGDHYALYPPLPGNKKSVELQLAFLQKHIPL